MVWASSDSNVHPGLRNTVLKDSMRKQIILFSGTLYELLLCICGVPFSLINEYTKAISTGFQIYINNSHKMAQFSGLRHTCIYSNCFLFKTK